MQSMQSSAGAEAKRADRMASEMYGLGPVPAWTSTSEPSDSRVWPCGCACFASTPQVRRLRAMELPWPSPPHWDESCSRRHLTCSSGPRALFAAGETLADAWHAQAKRRRVGDTLLTWHERAEVAECLRGKVAALQFWVSARRALRRWRATAAAKMVAAMAAAAEAMVTGDVLWASAADCSSEAECAVQSSFRSAARVSAVAGSEETSRLLRMQALRLLRRWRARAESGVSVECKEAALRWWRSVRRAFGLWRRGARARAAGRGAC
eukprot:1843559-Pleurochrysis_carterae.AAC.1